MDDEGQLHGDLHGGAVAAVAVEQPEQSVLDSLAEVPLPADGLVLAGSAFASIDNLTTQVTALVQYIIYLIWINELWVGIMDNDALLCNCTF